MKIKTVCMFANGMMAAFDDKGEQISELQIPLIVMWAEKAKELGYEINGLVVECQNARNMKIFEWEYDGETGINFEVI